MHIGWPQGIMLAMYVFAIGFVVAVHGKPRGNYSIWATLIAAAINLTLLYYGGFFSQHG